MITEIWNWIAHFNNFTFECTTIDDLWFTDACIPFKDRLLIELLRGAVLWSISLNRNALCFNQTPTSMRKIDAQILSLAQFWCKANSDALVASLDCILPKNITKLSNQLYTRQIAIGKK